MDKRRRKLRIAAALLAVLIILGGVTAWLKLYRDVPQPSRSPAASPATSSTARSAPSAARRHALLGSGCPAAHLPGFRGAPGATPPSNRPWDQGRELPAGFARKTVGYVRVGGNCSLPLHLRPGPDGVPVVAAPIPARPGTPASCSRSTRGAPGPRFNADEILSEIGMVTKLSVLDQLL